MSDRVPTTKFRRAATVVLIGAFVVAMVLAVVFAIKHVLDTNTAHRLLATEPGQVMSHKDLVAYANAEGKALFARNCAACHGADMKGMAATGAPNLTDQTWLYGDGELYEIERTILYGIRSDNKKSHNVTEMPAFGQRGQLSEGDINNVVQYLYRLSGRPNDAGAADLGKAVYNGNTTCGDCHGPDGKGSPDYGAPDLTANVWNYGGDPRSLYNSIYYGRHGTMPAWYGKLTLEQIRALSVYVYSASHR